MFESVWMLLTVLGPIVLAAVIAYALITRRRLTPRERVEQHEAVEDVYDGGEGGEDAARRHARERASEPERVGR